MTRSIHRWTWVYCCAFMMDIVVSAVAACSSGVSMRVPSAPETFLKEMPDFSYKNVLQDVYCQDLPIKYAMPYRELPQKHHYLIRSAIEKWEVAVGKELFEEVELERLEDDPEKGVANGIVEFCFPDELNKGGTTYQVVAVAWVRYDSILKSDIWYSPNYHWGDLRTFLLRAPAERIRLIPFSDIEEVTLHELGHVLGLDHVNIGVDKESVMTPHRVPEVRSRRYPSMKDIARVQKSCGCAGTACDHVSTYRTLTEMP